MIDRNALKQLINDKGLKLSWLADHMDLGIYSLSRRLAGETEFRPSEINRLRELLELNDEQFMDIFFSNHVAE